MEYIPSSDILVGQKFSGGSYWLQGSVGNVVKSSVQGRKKLGFGQLGHNIGILFISAAVAAYSIDAN